MVKRMPYIVKFGAFTWYCCTHYGKALMWNRGTLTLFESSRQYFEHQVTTALRPHKYCIITSSGEIDGNIYCQKIAMS